MRKNGSRLLERPRSHLANYVNGVLIIAVAKRAEARPKQIPKSTGPKAIGAGRESSPLKSVVPKHKTERASLSGPGLRIAKAISTPKPEVSSSLRFRGWNVVCFEFPLESSP